MDKKILALVGVAMLVIGALLPVISAQGDSASLLLPGEGIGLDGIFLVVFALVAGGLALVGQVRHVVWPALASLGLIAYDFFRAKGELDRLAAQAGDSAFAAAMSDAVQLNYLGWAVLVIGGVILLVAGIMAWSGPKAAAPPPPAV